MNTLTWIITILGFIATIIGSLLALVTYTSPLIRLKFYLKREKKWKKVNIGRVEYNWQYKNHPEFTIETDDESRDWDTVESWMNHYPDSLKHATLVKVKVNGQVLLTEEFISLDGGRYFVPVPKRRAVNDSEFKYWYTQLQVNLARIIGCYYRSDTIEEFMDAHRLEIRKDEDYS